MWILVTEAMGALGLLLFIVWWTLGPTHRRERDAMRRAVDESARDADTAPDRPDRDPKRSVRADVKDRD